MPEQGLKMRRIFIQGPLSDFMDVKGETARHIGFSLRMAVGDLLGVAGQDGRCGEAEIVRMTGETVTLALQKISDSTEPPVDVWLAQALPKGDKMDLIVQKAVELGVKGIFPLQTQHCIVRYDVTKQAEKIRRWQKISQESAQQCGRGMVPTVGPFVTLPLLFEITPADTQVLMLYESEGRQGLRSLLTQDFCGSWLLIVGPEGGFDESEAAFCRSKGARLAGLGPRILRTETAGLAALSAIMYECGDLGGM
jgi:16S rRNA (uracil1498-N3)-methyltransferase